MAEEDWTDSKIAQLVLAVGLAELNRVLDQIMADTVYSNAEGFKGFAYSDEKTLRAIEYIRKELADEGAGDERKTS